MVFGVLNISISVSVGYGEGNQLSMWMANVVECCVVICSVLGSSFVLQSNAKCTHEEVYMSSEGALY